MFAKIASNLMLAFWLYISFIEVLRPLYFSRAEQRINKLESMSTHVEGIMNVCGNAFAHAFAKLSFDQFV